MNDVPDALVGELRGLAERLAREAGTIALDGRRSFRDSSSVSGATTTVSSSAIDTKSSRTDLVTRFDRAAEAHVVATLTELRPDDAIVGEEGTEVSGTSGFAWYIDPIDGTTNYVYDQPAWSCSVAVAHHGVMIAGAVAVPPLDEMFTAGRGQGATRDGLLITPSSETDLSLALVGTGFSYQAETRGLQAERLVGIITHVRDIRRLGSAAVDLCMVACGRLDVYYEQGLNSWDAAAGELIAREAGAVTSDFDGAAARPDQMLAAAPGVHAAFLDVLRDVRRDVMREV